MARLEAREAPPFFFLPMGRRAPRSPSRPAPVRPRLYSVVPSSPSVSPPLSSVLSNFAYFIRRFFYFSLLPVDFPASVRPDYAKYQMFDSIQALSSYLRGLLCTQAIFQGLGVGRSGAAESTAAAATAQWMAREGISLIASLGLGSLFSGEFGSELKRWRMIADLSNDLGLFLELLSPALPRIFFLPALMAASTLKTICGVSATASKSALVQHFALRQNAADLSTKEGSQEILVTLAGLALGLLVNRWVGENFLIVWAIFAILTAVHVWANVEAMRCVSLTTINAQRARRLAEEFSTSGRVLRPEEIAAREKLFYWEKRIFIGVKPQAGEYSGPQHQRNDKYCLVKQGNGPTRVFLSEKAVVSDEFQALLHAIRLESNKEEGGGVSAALWAEEKGRVENFLVELDLAGWEAGRPIFSQPFKCQFRREEKVRKIL